MYELFLCVWVKRGKKDCSPVAIGSLRLFIQIIVSPRNGLFFCLFSNYNIHTTRIFRLMHRLLTALFWGVGASFFRGALMAASSTSLLVGRAVVGASAVLAGFSVQKEAAPVNPEDPKEVYNFYMHLWKLFYLSYFVLPLAR